MLHRAYVGAVALVCLNQHVDIGKESSFISPDGYLMPTRKDQPPPDPRYFKTAK